MGVAEKVMKNICGKWVYAFNRAGNFNVASAALKVTAM